MVFGLFKRRRRRKLIEQPSPRWWAMYLRDNVPFYSRLSLDEQQRICGIARVLMAEKHWVGTGGIKVEDRAQLNIAIHAARLILNIDHDYYRRVRSIYLWPTAIKLPQRTGILERQVNVVGAAMDTDAIVLAADAVIYGTCNDHDGRNVVYHEFAHKLDTLDHAADGTPPLSDKVQYHEWHRVMSKNYEQLVTRSKKGRATLLDKYGSTNAAEFFAVATECFFEKSKQMHRKHPEMYRLLCDYYKQNPA